MVLHFRSILGSQANKWKRHKILMVYVSWVINILKCNDLKSLKTLFVKASLLWIFKNMIFIKVTAQREKKSYLLPKYLDTAPISLSLQAPKIIHSTPCNVQYVCTSQAHDTIPLIILADSFLSLSSHILFSSFSLANGRFFQWILQHPEWENYCQAPCTVYM